MIRLPLGTKEDLVIDVTDRLEGITTLTGTNPVFDVRLRDSNTWVFQSHSGSPDGMSLFCFIDTTGFDPGVYELFCQFENLPEAPRLGPFDFEVFA